MEWENLEPPSPQVGATHIQVSGVKLDLRHDFRFIALNYGAEERGLTLGWIALENSPGNYCGLAMAFSEVRLFEAAFSDPEAVGALESWELRRDPDPMLIFVFAGGTLRVAAGRLRAELVDGDDGDGPLPVQ